MTSEAVLTRVLNAAVSSGLGFFLSRPMVQGPTRAGSLSPALNIATAQPSSSSFLMIWAVQPWSRQSRGSCKGASSRSVVMGSGQSRPQKSGPKPAIVEVTRLQSQVPGVAAGATGATLGVTAGARVMRVLPPVVISTTASPPLKLSLPLAWMTERRSPLRSCTMISSASSLVAERSIALPTTAPATAPSTPTTWPSRRPPTEPPAIAPTAPPATAPTPLCEPSTVTGRTDSTVASWTCESRWASPRWTTSGLVVEQADSATAAARVREVMSLDIRGLSEGDTGPQRVELSCR
mmetsp:Transcript_13044/g.52028  ORF Transcript_13044/g.52028 Transcript_13044/m.52028 type:complete len:293 (-) Transcript_13044:1816-2694(-)